MWMIAQEVSYGMKGSRNTKPGILGAPFKLVTDRAPLMWLQKTRDMNARLTLWCLSLWHIILRFLWRIIRGGPTLMQTFFPNRKQGWKGHKKKPLLLFYRGGGVWGQRAERRGRAPEELEESPGAEKSKRGERSLPMLKQYGDQYSAEAIWYWAIPEPAFMGTDICARLWNLFVLVPGPGPPLEERKKRGRANIKDVWETGRSLDGKVVKWPGASEPSPDNGVLKVPPGQGREGQVLPQIAWRHMGEEDLLLL